MLATSGGVPLTLRGPAESRADYYIHLCFASQRLWLYSRKDALAAVLGKKPVLGSRAGASQKNTGAGVLLLPAELKARCYGFTPNARWLKFPLGLRGEKEAAFWLQCRLWVIRPATKNEQISGVDFFAARDNNEWLAFDAKARDVNYSKLFVQTHEANPDKLWK